MSSSKIIIDGEEVTFSLGIDEDEIETNEFATDTLDLTEVVESINGSQ